MVFVTSPYLPSIKKYIKYVESIYENKWLTNNGPLVRELTTRLEERLNIKNLLLTSSGTMSLQIAFRLKQLENQSVITTPFSFHATYSALEWQGANVGFCDIDRKTWNLDIDKLEQILSSGKKVDCVVPVHTFGTPCDVEKIKKLKDKFNFNVIYDSAHAITTRSSKGKNILSYGDISCFSLHATKLFHTVEGGGIVFSNPEEHEIASSMINFGLEGEKAFHPGINGKLSEFHAAMGLAILDDLTMIEEDRFRQKEFYTKLLNSRVNFQDKRSASTISPSYMPVLFEEEPDLVNTITRLNTHDVYPRRYFNPALHQMPIVKQRKVKWSLPEAEYVAKRVLCLPLYFGQTNSQIKSICNLFI
ncbi:DegT/DnrJ/EryC1/StrS family aminotransferase [Pseudoalteromonas sp. SWXJZ10B]|uniref:DegT/DnrJ/EryC1/StrS family aminotransferase n=1 Tax=Pseudoalteromonas sp. SWXJZ10B TaxID=2792063 RepID=UPI0018CDC725|nr:aminotransferase class I/II-fold pyridoxal phosphate-dependent enzyme [Pseudoalteromonas sp. SWXJZ10B]MBH0042955.1 aminotransferase class I/II-fold pyridoxal phosphate-dependent enzyme [Pseudoalteromonas sp. SWXJZ10B]